MHTEKFSSPQEGYFGLYLERSGVGARDMAEQLLNPPELPLDAGSLTEVIEYENNLFEARVDGSSLESIIRSQKSEDVVAPLFFGAAFVDGSVDVSACGATVFESAEEAYVWLSRSIDEKTIAPDQLLALARESSRSYKRKTEEALLSGAPLDANELHAMSLVVEPEKAISQAQLAAKARAVLKAERKGQYSEGDLEGDAKAAIVEVYLARINAAVAENVAVMQYLVEQSDMIGKPEVALAAVSAIPAGLRNALSGESRQDVFRRLDYLRNGIAVLGEGRTSVVSDKLVNLDLASVEENAAVFSKEETRILKSTMLQPAEIQGIFSRVIAKGSLLSSEDPQSWNKDRKFRAADDLFQVHENPSKATFQVNGISGAYLTPPEPRSIYDVMVVGGFHELTHINQAQSDRALGQTLKICTLRGKRTSMLTEGGANMVQREAEVRFFGKSKPWALTYGHALQALENGGSIFDATKAFYEEKRRVMPDIAPEVAAREATDRVMRLVRGGGLSSQPMAYAEEAILARELDGASPEVLNRATAISSLDFVDQRRLHKYGLLPTVNRTSIDWTKLIVEELQPHITTALQASDKPK
ncbi:MAG TPA: hypothetical protein VLG16_03020 [Candidatus Saccharimonadales bacterium]|nr:hypothetical protein [Candidatus Saccharimonadales bacterium]